MLKLTQMISNTWCGEGADVWEHQPSDVHNHGAKGKQTTNVTEIWKNLWRTKQFMAKSTNINELYLFAWFVCVYACALFVILFILISQFDCDDMIAHMKRVQSLTTSLTSNSDFYLYSIRIYTSTYTFFARLNNNMAWSESNAQKLRQLRCEGCF